MSENGKGDNTDARLGVEEIRRDLDRYSNLQCFAILKLFRQARGRNPSTVDETEEWLETQHLPQALDPFTILSREEIRECSDLFQ